MGVFIKNKSKKIQTNTSSKPELFINPDNSKVVAVENNIPDKRSVKIGVVDKKSTTIEFKKPLVKNVITPPLEIKATITKKDSDADIIDVVVKNEEVTKPTANEALIDKNKIDNILIFADTKLNNYLTDINLSFIDLLSFKDFIKNKRIALIANSSDLLNHEHGKKIDEYDIVIRFNSFKIDQIHTGKKTTIHASIHLQDVNLDRFAPIRFIVSNSISKWVNKIITLNKFKQTFILKYNHPIILGLNYHRQLTTGLNTLITLLKIGGFKNIDLFGFTFYENWENSILRTKDGMDYPISKVHDYDFEKSFIYQNMTSYNKEDNIFTFYDNRSL